MWSATDSHGRVVPTGGLLGGGIVSLHVFKYAGELLINETKGMITIPQTIVDGILIFYVKGDSDLTIRRNGTAIHSFTQTDNNQFNRISIPYTGGTGLTFEFEITNAPIATEYDFTAKISDVMFADGSDESVLLLESFQNLPSGKLTQTPVAGSNGVSWLGVAGTSAEVLNNPLVLIANESDEGLMGSGMLMLANGPVVLGSKTINTQYLRDSRGAIARLPAMGSGTLHLLFKSTGSGYISPAILNIYENDSLIRRIQVPKSSYYFYQKIPFSGDVSTIDYRFEIEDKGLLAFVFLGFAFWEVA